MNDEFVADLLMEINKFRQTPLSIEKKMDTFKLALTRFKNKQNNEFIAEIDRFAATLKDIKKIPKIKLNEELCKAAEKQVIGVSPEINYRHFVIGNDLRNIIPDKYLDQNCLMISDDGVDSPDNLLLKILMNREDPRRYGRKYILDPEYLEMGAATKEGSDEDCDIVIIFCKHYAEDPQIELPDMDLTELKKAFDLFDVHKIKKIDPKETTKAMLSIGFDQKNPQLFSIMKELEDKGELIDFPTFAWHIVGKITDTESEEGLRTIFNIFVDDHRDNTISIFVLKKIIRELGIPEAEDEINKLLETKGAANVKLTFEEFYDFMNNYYKGERPKKMQLGESQIKPQTNTRTRKKRGGA